MMNQHLKKTISKGWPPNASMTLRADDVYRQSATAQVQDPGHFFQKAQTWMTAIQNTHDLTPNQADTISHEVHEAMIRAIFGSNMIERAGQGLDITVELCRKVFSGEEMGPVTESSTDYQDALLSMYRHQPELQDIPARHVLRSRNEIVQHAKAFQFIINAFVTEKRDLTEDIIKETHRILTTGVSIIEPDTPEVPPSEYGAKYRTVIVGAGTTNFTVPKFIPSQMKQMCQNLKDELTSAEHKKEIDPFAIASKYSMEFVQIHPFQDGNGRMCRMILNAILCRYAGIIVPIGEQANEREEYMGIKRRASTEMEGHGEYATFILQRSVTRLREMKKKLAGKSK